MSSLSPRDEILKTKQYDLTHCVTARKRKLAELYNVTTAYTRNCATEHHSPGTLKTHHQQDRDVFLEQNNISLGLLFKLSTLPSVVPLTPTSQTRLIYAQEPDPVDKLGATSTITADVSNRYDPSSKEPNRITPRLQDKLIQATEIPSTFSSTIKLAGPVVHGRTTDQNSASSITIKLPSPQAEPDSSVFKAFHEAATFSPLGSAGSIATVIADADEELGTLRKASKTSPLEPDDAILGSAVAITGQRSNGTHTLRLSPVNVQDSQIRSENARDGRIHNHVEELREESSESRGVRDVSVQGSPVNRTTDLALLQVRDVDDLLLRDISSQGRVAINNKQVDIHANTQVGIDQNPAFPGIPSTPDEQLRLEEAQSMKMASSAVAVTSDPEKKAEAKNSEVVVDLGSQHIEDEMEAERASSVLPSPMLGIVDETQGSLNAFRGRERSVVPPMARQRDSRIPGMLRHLSKDLTLSQRPPMHINTDIPYNPSQINANSNTAVSSLSTAQPSIASDSPAPVRPNPASIRAPSPPERMTTRVSSGALRHKSVSEILGETPKTATHHSEKASADRSHRESYREDVQTPSSTSFNPAPDSSSFRSRLLELREREKERSKLSTVVFARQQPQNTATELDQAQLSDINSHSQSWKQDYLLPLFVAQAAAPPQSLHPPLAALLASAHKTLSTENLLTEFHEQQDCRILRKIYQLQHANRWSLRQLERSFEPIRPTTHWDVLLGQMKWMRTDFREERKWKITAAKILADWCAAWVSCDTKERRLLQVNFRCLPVRSLTDLTSMPTPDLVSSIEDDSSDAMDDDAPLSLIKQPFAPATIFSYAPDDIVFSLDKTPASEKLLSELPLYQPSLDLESAVLSSTDFTPDRTWQTAIVPLSKFAEGKLTTSDAGTPRKRRRYDYEDIVELEGEPTIRLTDSLPGSTKDIIRPEQEDIALFDPENKHIRDRIHAGHAFRPPTDCSMPSQAFFQSRHSSQWTAGEDDELRRLVKEYAFNWSLISSCLSTTSLFSSGAERRTPWECFERWVNHLEGLPSEMSKLAYFKAYSSRLQAAQRTLEQQYGQQTHNANAQQVYNRRRNALPIRVDRRKNSKHLALIHAMQKLAKKRETALQKQQHVAGLAAMRKANETTQLKTTIRTPREFSVLKRDREIKQKQYEQQVMHHQQKVAYQQRVAQQNGQQQIASTGMQPTRNQEAASGIGATPVVTNALPNSQIITSVPGQSRSLPVPTRAPNGQANGIPAANTPVGMNGIPQAPMHNSMQGPTSMVSEAGGESIRMLQEASRAQQDQQRFLQRQHLHSQNHGHGHSISSPNTVSQNNVGMPANPQAMNNKGSPPANGNGVSGPSGPINSPNMATNSQPIALSGGTAPLVTQIASQVKAGHPQASPEQLSKMTNEALAHYRNHTRAAMQAASGSNAALFANNSNINMHQLPPQQGLANGSNGGQINMYATLMRNQQQSQQNRMTNGNVSGALPTSRSATPSVPPFGSGGQIGPAQGSPQLPHVQPAGGQ